MTFSVSDILKFSGGRLANASVLGGREDSIRLKSVGSLRGSREDQCVFFFSKAYQAELPSAHPGVLVTGEPFVKPLEASGLPLWRTSAVVACEDPYLAMAVLSEHFAKGCSTVVHEAGARRGSQLIHPMALVDASVEMGAGVQVGAFSVVAENVRIGAGTVIYPNCYIGPGCVIGEDCVIFPQVTLYEWTQIGNRVRLHAGCVIGADGFGYAPVTEKREGTEPKVINHQKIYHLGRVVIGDDVELGASVTVDRGTLDDTRIAKNAKVDDKVHVGHNVQIDEGAIICGCVGLAGSARVGKFAYIGGIAGIGNGVLVGDRAMIGAMSIVTKEVEPGTIMMGNPLRSQREHFKVHAMLNRMLEERKSKK